MNGDTSIKAWSDTMHVSFELFLDSETDGYVTFKVDDDEWHDIRFNDVYRGDRTQGLPETLIDEARCAIDDFWGKSFMEWEEVLEHFEEAIRPLVPKGDAPALRGAFNDYAESLHRDGRISQWSVENMIGPQS